MQLISKIKVKECSIISSFKSTSFDMFLTSSYSRRSTSRISALKSAKEVLIFQELCILYCVWIGRGCQSNCWTVTTIFWSTWGRIGTIEEATCEAANPFVCDNNNNMFAIGLDLYQDFREQHQASFGLATYKNKFFWRLWALIIRGTLWP